MPGTNWSCQFLQGVKRAGLGVGLSVTDLCVHSSPGHTEPSSLLYARLDAHSSEPAHHTHTHTQPHHQMAPPWLASMQSTILTILAQFLNSSRASLDGLPVHQLK